MLLQSYPIFAYVHEPSLIVLVRHTYTRISLQPGFDELRELQMVFAIAYA